MVVDSNNLQPPGAQIAASAGMWGRRALVWPWAINLVDLTGAARAWSVSRALLLVATFVAMRYPPIAGRHPAATVWDAWYQWDVRWYVRVARSGYHWHDLRHFASVAFFPLYPLLIAAVLLVVPLSAKLAALLVANLSFFLGLYVLHGLVRRELGSAAAARTTLYLSLFPTALFFFAGYSESLFLLLTLLAISAMRQRQWLAAGCWGGLAAVTRSEGIVLMLPFAIEFWEANEAFRQPLRKAAAILLIPAGWVFLASYMLARFGRPLLFIDIQRAWHRTSAWPWQGLVQTVQHISPQHLTSFRSMHNAIELSCLFAFAALIVVGVRRVPRSFTAYAAAALLLPLCSPAVLDHFYLPLRSMSRFCLALFPCFIILAILPMPARIAQLLMVLSSIFLIIATLTFLQGKWVA